MIITWAEKVGKRGRTKSSCPRNNFPCDKTYFKEGNYFDRNGRCKGIYFDDHSLLSTFSSMTSLDVYFDAHATQLELSFRSDVWRASLRNYCPLTLENFILLSPGFLLRGRSTAQAL